VSSKSDREKEVFLAARDFGLSSVLFRNATGRKLGLNITDSESLSLLSINGVSTPTELARHTGLTTGSTTALLDRLEKIHFITRKPNPDDRRGVLVEIDKHYQELAWPLIVGMQQAHRELLASYTEEELTIIADFLRRFTKNVTDQTDRIND